MTNLIPLGEIVDIRGGGTPDKQVPAYWNGDIPWASVKDFKSGVLDRTVDRITPEGVAASATQVIPAGHIIVPTRMAVGKAAINTIDLAINQDLKALFPKPDVDTRYLYHALLRNSDKLLEQATGATVKGIKLDVLRGLKIPLPPLDEQKRIAGILDQAAELCRLRTRALDKLSTLGQAIFHEMFGSGSFERVALAEVIEARSSLADPTLPENAQLPHVGPEHIRQGGAEIEWDRVVSCAQDGVTSGKYQFEPNDIIYSKIRPYLNKVAIADRVGMCSADMYALVANSDVVKNSYLHFILLSESKSDLIDFPQHSADMSDHKPSFR